MSKATRTAATTGVISVLVLVVVLIGMSRFPAEALPDCSQSFPNLVDKPSGSGVIRVATINTDGGAFNGESESVKDTHLDKLSELIACLEADVVVLSEIHRLDRYWPEFDMINQIKSRAADEGYDMERVFQHQCKLPNGGADNSKAWVGNAIMSTDDTNSGGYDNGFLEVNYDHFNDSTERSYAIQLPTDIASADSSGYPGGWGHREGRCFANADTVTRNRGRHKGAVAAVTLGGVEVIGLHLSPSQASADVRRWQLEELASQVEDFRESVDGVLGSGDRLGIMAGDFNEDDCIFHGQCPAGDGVVQYFSGEGWVNATEDILETTDSGSKIDHIFVRGFDFVDGSDQTHARAMNVDFLNHHVVYGDFEES